MAKKKKNGKATTGGGSGKGASASGSVAMAYGATDRVREPVITQPAKGSIRIKHREHFTSVEDTTIFQHWNINPGRFPPWLSTIANSFESYVCHSLAVEWTSRCATDTPGACIIGMDYDPADVVYDAPGDLLGTKGTISTNLWKNAVWRMDSSDERTRLRKFVSPSTSAVSSRMRQEDVGILYIAIDGAGTTDTAVGDVWVSYDFTLYTPQKSSTTRGGARVDGGSAPTLTPSNPFGLEPVKDSRSVQPVLPGEPVSPVKFYLEKVGQYLMHVSLIGTGIAGTPTVTVESGDATPIFNTGTATNFEGLWRLNITDLAPEPYFTISNIPATTITDSVLRISGWSPGIAD
jgi:hypothetical protein